MLEKLVDSLHEYSAVKFTGKLNCLSLEGHQFLGALFLLKGRWSSYQKQEYCGNGRGGRTQSTPR